MGRAAVPGRVVPEQPVLSCLFSPGEMSHRPWAEEGTRTQRSLWKEMGEVGTWRLEHSSRGAQICSGEVWEAQRVWSHSQKPCWTRPACSQIVGGVLGQHGQQEGWALPGQAAPGMGWRWHGGMCSHSNRNQPCFWRVVCDFWGCVVFDGVERVKHLMKSRVTKFWWGDWVEARAERAVLQGRGGGGCLEAKG